MLRLIGIGVLAFVLTGGTVVLATGAYLLSGGVATCKVDTPEVQLSFPLPARLPELVLKSVRWFGPDIHDDDWAEAQRWLGVADEAIGALEHGQGVLVEVQTAEEHVRVARRGSKLLVDVDAPDAKVEVTFPVRSLRRIVREVSLLGAV